MVKQLAQNCKARGAGVQAWAAWLCSGLYMFMNIWVKAWLSLLSHFSTPHCPRLPHGANTAIFFPPQDWTDYDEKAQESVGIYEVTHQFVKCWTLFLYTCLEKLRRDNAPRAIEPTETHPLIPCLRPAAQAPSLHAELCYNFPSPTNKAHLCRTRSWR